MGEENTGQNLQSTGYIVKDVELMNANTDQLLQSIAASLIKITNDDGISISQSSLNDMAIQIDGESRANRNRVDRQSNRDQSAERRNNAYSNRGDKFDTNDLRRRGKVSAGKFFDELTDTLEDEFIKSLTGSAHPIQDALKGPLAQFANSLGVDIKDLSKELGSRLGKQLGNAFKDSDLGQQLQSRLGNLIGQVTGLGSDVLSDLTNILNDPDSLSRMINGANAGRSRANQSSSTEEMVNNGMDAVQNMVDNGDDAMQALANGASSAAGTMSTAATAMSASAATAGTELAAAGAAAGTAEAGAVAMAGGGAAASGALAGVAAALGPVALLLPLITILLEVGKAALEDFNESLQPMKDGWDNLVDSFHDVGHRVKSENSKNLDESKKRIEADVKTLVTVPFDILKDAANTALDTWDAVLQTITATQEYNKEDVQALWGVYAQRLQDEGLDSVISSADMMQNLENVIKSGLSGAVAEEFAYTATVLNNALPTQDFFQYAETYAALAANAISNGADQEAALQYANEELEAFASNIIYASRQLTGGFASGLKNASSLFDDAAKIALTSKTGSVSEISAVLTSVSALVSSIAPDLAGGVVDAVVKAAIGGNSNEITALRSMTSVGASNTAFLTALAKDPQKVFSELFENLAELQNMSADNFMEVAEGLSSVFGLSMDAFARVDFNYLAKAIRDMNANSDSLSTNLALLQSGQTTQTAAQLRMQQINQYMLEEGLAYVLDNEVARQVQQHMWEEQIAGEITESTFAVELQGAAVDFLASIVEAVNNILEYLNMSSLAFEVENVELTKREVAQITEDLTNVLKAQKVGSGEVAGAAQELTNLLTRNADLNLIGKYPELIGLEANYGSSLLQKMNLGSASGSNWLYNLLVGGGVGSDNEVPNMRGKASQNKKGGSSGNKFYNWGLISKTEGVPNSGDWRSAESYNPIWDSAFGKVLTQVSQGKVQKFLDTMADYTSEMAAISSTTGSAAKMISSQREKSDYKYLTQSELEDFVLNSNIEEDKMSFEKWIESGLDFGILNLGQVLADYGLTIEDIRSKFQQYQTLAESKADHARQLHEVQFWENVEEYNNNYFPNHFENEFLRKDWMENWETNYLTPIRDDLHQLLTDWEDYYIHHTAYTDATANAFESAIELAGLEQDEMGDSVLALAQALTENSNWLQENQELLKDPVVHANVLLAQILTVTEAIMQQNNSTATTGAIPTTLLGLGTGGVS